MPTIILQLPDGPTGCAIKRRLLIGRRLSNDIVINDARISRIHAILEPRREAVTLQDNHSRTGTLVNGQRLTGRRRLADGDRIEIGGVRLTYRAADTLPQDVRPLRHASPESAGITFACVCGNVMWVPLRDAGLRGICRRCRRPVVAPLPELTSADLADPDANAAQICGICQCQILPGEATTACPSCGLRFHGECWIENRGCAAYGCAQVNALATDTDADAAPGVQRSAPEPALGTPWDLPLLAGSCLAALLGIVTFGATALLAGILAVRYLRRPRRRRAPALAAVVVSAVGIPLGVAGSMAYWLDKPLLFWMGS